MEEDGAVKAPMTRLRRRLSVEQTEDTKSPSAPSTPTKKRGKLAAKPQLELIEENAPQNSPAKRSTRKSIARDIVEPLEEKVLTPSRRSTRTKSNTSIMSDSIQAVESPRAARVTRRLSQVGSDNEAPVTPSRVTRRTRKDSTSSMDKTVIDTPVKTPGRARRTRKDSTTSVEKQGDSEISSSLTQNDPDEQTVSKNVITEVIVEEPETESRKSVSHDTAESKKSPNVSPLRKSPRLRAKNNRTSENKEETDEMMPDSQDQKEEIKSHNKNNDVQDEKNYENPQDELSTSCTELLNEIHIRPAVKPSNLNKSMPAAKQEKSSKTKRQRTKSWSTLVVPSKNEENFYSDNEIVKKKLKKHEKVFSLKLNDSGSGDNLQKKTTDKNEVLNDNLKNCNIPDKEAKSANTSSESYKENLTHDSSVTNLLFQKAPSAEMQSLIFIEDSDTDSLGKQRNICVDTEDQCVPTVPDVTKVQRKPIQNSNTSLNTNDKNGVFNIFSSNNVNDNNDICEPMDIDETMPEDITLNDSAKDIENESILKTKTSRKSSICLNDKEFNKSKRKSSIGNVTNQEESSKSLTSSLSQDIETSSNEKINKSKRKSSISHISCQESAKSGSRSSSICVPDEEAASTDNKLNKPKRKSSITSQASIDRENVLTVTEDDLTSGKNSRSSSFTVPDEDDCLKAKLNTSKRKSQLSNEAENSQRTSISIVGFEGKSDGDISLHEKYKKSQRKSSLGNLTSQELEKSNNENKSTLVLSQLQDMSSVAPSPKSELSKSLTIANVSKDAPLNHNLSLNCLTSTPVQQKDFKKLAKRNNASTLALKDHKNSEKTEEKDPSRNSKQDRQDDSSDSDSNSSNEESSQKMLDDEAEEASEDYESGDSQDEEERQYAEDHEIIDKGLTLTSEEEFSDDTDYEKDSFVISSDEEDHELLSGSEDDLGMSDNELTMSAKSKQKFNDRMRKKQKSASKEMYEARHGFKTKTSRLDSTNESETEIMAPPKKNKRMRLDSNWDSSVGDEIEKKSKSNISDISDIGTKKKKKSKRLSESMNENITPEGVSDSKMDESVTSEIGRKINKAKRLSESKYETLIENIDTKEAKSDNSTLDTSAANKSNNKDIEKLSVSKCTDSQNKNSNISVSTDSVKAKKKKHSSETVGESVVETGNNSQMEVPISAENKKKQRKRLSESLCNDSVINEKEITVLDNSVLDKEDPLMIRVKQEPKTPQKVLDISTVNFTTIEEVKVDENASMMKANETSDPLQDDGDDDSDVSSLSENEVATKNYDAILSQLNKENNKIKTHDTSLNLQKKTKSSKNPVIEQLNITQTKKEKKVLRSNENKAEKEKKVLSSNDNKFQSSKKIVNQSDEEATSDSIDLKLLFSEDSNDSSIVNNKKTENKDSETFIPLRRTEGKTDISVNGSGGEQDPNTSLQNSSTKKKKNRKSLQSDDAGVSNDTENNFFFIDTVGTKVDNTASPKKRTSLPQTENSKAVSSSDDSDVGPLEVQNKKEDENIVEVMSEKPKAHKKQNKNKLLSTSLNLVECETSKPDEKRGKKRKRDPSPVQEKEKIAVSTLGNAQTTNVAQANNSSFKKPKKLKVSHDINSAVEQPKVEQQEITTNLQSAEKAMLGNNMQRSDAKKPKKRKERDEDDIEKITKNANSSTDQVAITRLPSSILTRLEDKPKKQILEAKKAKVVATTEFIVQESVPKRIKPSSYLEESVYLNTDFDPSPQKKTSLKKPKVLPFVPTASTSDSGFTTKFQVNVIPEKIEFVAKSSTATNFKTEYLRDKRARKMRTYDIYKQNRNLKLSKY